MEIESFYHVKEVKFQRQYPGYLYRREVVDDSGFGGDGNLEMVNCYSSYSGHWIGGPKTARFICIKHGLRNVQKAHQKHCICSIGFNESEQKWYGWSHKAICGFGIGDMILEESFGDDRTLFVKHGSNQIKTMDDAKTAAIRFAASVS
ncbi:MAG: hypothetical protein SWO11_22775 [Thermodesulfobacteriota bacterium]|nr:hypothetical protein [Thermodesulfobacteriota bacterium]